MLRTAVFTPFRVIWRGLPHRDRACLASNSAFDTPAGSVIQMSLTNQACVPNALTSSSSVLVLTLYSGARVKLNKLCTEPVLTSLEGLPVPKVLLFLAVCLFEMKLTIPERVRAQGCPVALLGDTTSAH